MAAETNVVSRADILPLNKSWIQWLRYSGGQNAEELKSSDSKDVCEFHLDRIGCLKFGEDG